MSTFTLRQLSQQERERVFATRLKDLILEPYIDAVREMEGDVAYGIALNGVSQRAVKVRMNKAAKKLDLRLRWAATSKNATELIVELQP